MIQNNIITLIMQGAVVDIHRHTCLQIVLSLDQGFDCIIGNEQLQNLEGFIISPGIKHSCNAPQASVVVFLIEPESWAGWQLKEMLADSPFINLKNLLSAADINSARLRITLADTNSKKTEAANALLNSIIPLHTPATQNKQSIERMQAAVTYIAKNLHQQILLEEMAQALFLSPERARHLFAQQMGIPFTQYLIWKRIKSVIVAVVQNNISLKDAAIDYGFSHQAHFCRIFKRMFGVAAKPLLKNSRSVQFIVPAIS